MTRPRLLSISAKATMELTADTFRFEIPVDKPFLMTKFYTMHELQKPSISIRSSVENPASLLSSRV